MITEQQISAMSSVAWATRDRARVLGPTRVGVAVLASSGQIFGGCNLEHRYRSHDVHAEVAGIAGLVAGGFREFSAILVAAERDHFTPCGACLDWIFEVGGPDALVLVQSSEDGAVAAYAARDLMPEYPR